MANFVKAVTHQGENIELNLDNVLYLRGSSAVLVGGTNILLKSIEREDKAPRKKTVRGRAKPEVEVEEEKEDAIKS